MVPAAATPCNRAAMFTPSPIRSAIAFLNDVAEMNADTELDSSLRRRSRVALDHGVLNLNGAAHGVNHAAELDNSPIACALHHAAIVHGDRRVEEVAAKRAESRQYAILI